MYNRGDNLRKRSSYDVNSTSQKQSGNEERYMPSPNAAAISAAMNRLYSSEQNKAFCGSAVGGEPLLEGVDMYDVYMNVFRDDPEMFILVFLEVVKERNEMNAGRVAAKSALDTLLRSNVGISLDFLDALLEESVNQALRDKEGKKSE
jgi:hypothetical protein